MRDLVRNEFDDAFDQLSNLYVAPVENTDLPPIDVPADLIVPETEVSLDSILQTKPKTLNE